MPVPSAYRSTAVMTALLALGGVAFDAQGAVSNVPAGLKVAKDLGRADTSATINITVRLKLNDRAAFDQAVEALYDTASPTYHQWMSTTDLQRYAPVEAQRESVRQELAQHGLTVISTDAFGFSVRARGTIASVEEAFNTEIHQFQYNGKTFRVNVKDAHLNGAAGEYVSSVAGIESHQMRPHAVRALNPHTQEPLQSETLKPEATGFPAGSTTECLSGTGSVTLRGTTARPVATYSGTLYGTNPSLVCDYLPSELWAALGLDEIFAAGYNGAGQTIVLVEGYGYPTMEQDANAFSKMGGLPQLNASNFRIVYPEGTPNPNLGILTGWDTEIAIDLQSAHTAAPGAHIVVVATNGQDNEDFQQSISYIAEHDLGNTVSNSYGEDIDLIAGPEEQNSWEDVLEVAAAKGISVNFSSGDSGDNGVGSPVGAPSVPAVSPHATSVGGTSILNDPNNPGSTITTAWGTSAAFLELPGDVLNPPLPDFVGGSGGGESVYWPKPSWQHALPGTGRQTPDVSALADPYTGVPIVITVGTTQMVEYGWGGTSLACPIFSGFWALANQKAGHALGQAARLIAALSYGGVQDVLPKTDSTVNNVTGAIVTANGTTKYSASAIFGSSFLEGNTGFTSAIYSITPGAEVADFAFGLDTSLTVQHGWDNATGWGTPHGMTFIDAVTK